MIASCPPDYLLTTKILTRKGSKDHQSKKRKEENNISPRNRKACRSISTALLLIIYINHY
jgi:hypothetical protein